MLVSILMAFMADEPARHVAMAGPVSKIEYSRDGKYVAVGGAQGHVAVYATSGWAKAHEFKPGSSRIMDISFSPDSELIALASQDKSIRIVKRSGEAAHKFDSDGWGMAVSFSPDGKRLAGAFADGILRVWDAGSGAKVWAAEPSAAKAIHVRWSPKGDRIAHTDGSGWVIAVDAGTGKQAAMNKEHAGTPQFLAYSADGTKLLVSLARGGNTPALAVMDTVSLATQHNFESLMVDGGFTKDGSKVVGLGGDGDLRVFDMGTKQRAYKGNPISKHRFFKPERFALSPDGAMAVFTGDMIEGFGFYALPVSELK